MTAAALSLGIFLGLSTTADADTQAAPKDNTPPISREIAPCAEGSDMAARASACTQLIATGRFNGKELGGLYILRGKAQAFRRQYEAAVGDFSQALEIDHQATDALYNRAATYVLMGRTDLAMADFTELLKLAPGDPDTLFYRAQIYARQGKIEAAIDDLSGVLKTKPDDFDTRLTRAGLLIGLDRNAEAIDDLNILLKADPKAPAALYNRGRVEMLTGDFKAAVRDFAAAMENRDQNPYAALRLYIVTARTGKADPAPLAKAAKAFPPDQWPLQIVSLYQGKTSADDLTAMAGGLRDPLSRANVTAEVNYYLGQWALLKGKKSEALARLQAAIADPAAKDDLEYVDAGLELKRLKK
ncbi:MAG TPA: tetratricopeptide repeat protein [Dongiaceae bacterium]